ncbi:MAG TPA: nuclear transport factor 2 family protein [Candidatus Didemnitutus sp.]|nr:nuclear transport factor 2 family protein [Candidatus Didemnitutus sp.]
MKIEQIANGLVKLCKKARFADAVDTYYSPKIVSLEPAGDEREARGIDAIKAKGDWWVANHQVHRMDVAGPFIHKNQFVVRFTVDVTFKPSKKRFVLDELAIYTVRAGKIVHEQFFYHAG